MDAVPRPHPAVLNFDYAEDPFPFETLPEPLLCRALVRRGLEDFDENDPFSQVETPRSIAACTAEGIRPQDLTFVPFEAFQRAEVPDEVAQLRFEFFEAHRQDLLVLARAVRLRSLAGEEPLSSMAVRGDPSSQYRHTLDWFLEKLRALDLKIMVLREDWSQDPRSEEFKRIDPYASSRAAPCSLGQSIGPMGVPAFLRAKSTGSLNSTFASGFGATSGGLPLMNTERTLAAHLLGDAGSPTEASRSRAPLMDTDTALGVCDIGMSDDVLSASCATEGLAARGMKSTSSWWSCGASTWRVPASDSALTDTLRQIRTAPGTDWRELEAARLIEDCFGPRREHERKFRDERHEDEQKLADKRKKALVASFGSLEFEQRRKDTFRDIRECMSPPRGTARKKGGGVRARVNIVRQMQSDEASRRENFVKRINKQHDLEKWLDDDRCKIKLKFAQMNLEDRVRWHHNYASVEEERAADRAGVVEDFRRKQGQLEAAGQRVAEANAMKREVLNLRHTHRVLDEYRRRRKEEYEHQRFLDKLRVDGERRIEDTGGRVRFPAWCLAASQLRHNPSSPKAQLLLGDGRCQSPLSPTMPRSPTSASSARALRCGSPQAALGSSVVLPDVEAAEQLDQDELDWIRRVVSPKGGQSPSRRKLLSRTLSAPALKLAAAF